MWYKLFLAPKDELEAARIALADDKPARALLALRAGLALTMNPNDTAQVLYLAFAVDRESIQRITREFTADVVGQALLREQAAIDSKHVDFAALRALPPDTLGGAYVRMLDAKQLDPDFFQRPPGLPDDLAYVAQRLRQTHDIWHALTGLDTDIPGEVALQAFTYAQLRQNFSLILVVFGLLFFSLRYPHMWRMAVAAHRQGNLAARLLTTRWEELWALPLRDVRARFGITGFERHR